MYIFQIIFLSFNLECEKNENKQKEAGIAHLKNPQLKPPFLWDYTSSHNLSKSTQFGPKAKCLGLQALQWNLYQPTQVR